MAKNNEKVEGSAARHQSRQSRKEELIAQKQAEQLRNIRIVVIIVAILLAAVVLFALVNEYILSPRREVASVGSDVITLREFQDRVRFERAQRIITLEDQLEMFNNDVGMVQQFGGQAINELQSTEALGEVTLNRMAQNEIIMQAAAERGIEISEEEIDQRIEESFGYFGGESPTPAPTPVQTAVPTPSITPIGFVAGDVEEPPVAPPSDEVLPSPTPVSAEAFQQDREDFLAEFTDLGASEDVYRNLVAASIATEELLDVLAEEQALPEEEEHASSFIITIPTEEEAAEIKQAIEDSDFLTVWNTIKSAPPVQESDADPATAAEYLWQTRDALLARVGESPADAIFSTPLNEVSEIITIAGADGTTRYVIVSPSGREIRQLSANELQQRKLALLSELIDNAVTEDVEIGEYWRSRVPTLPILNPKFLQPPTPAPEIPVPEGELPTAE